MSATVVQSDPVTREDLQGLNTPAIIEIAKAKGVTANMVGMKKDAVIQLVLDAQGGTPATAPGVLTKEQIEERKAAARARIEADNNAREAAKPAKSRKAPWEATPTEVSKRAGSIGYALGVNVWTSYRMKKEGDVLAAVVNAIGDGLTTDDVLAAKQEIIKQYAHAFDRYAFPSPACEKVERGPAYDEGIWQEIVALGTPLLIAQLLGDQPQTDNVPDE